MYLLLYIYQFVPRKLCTKCAFLWEVNPSVPMDLMEVPWLKEENPGLFSIEDWVVVSNIFYVHPCLGKWSNFD